MMVRGSQSDANSWLPQTLKEIKWILKNILDVSAVNIMEWKTIKKFAKDVKQKLLPEEKLMNLDDIVRLWYKTQMGNIHECRKNQLIFSDIMWKLYKRLKEKEWKL